MPGIAEVGRVTALAFPAERAERRPKPLDELLHGRLGVDALVADAGLDAATRAGILEQHPVDRKDLRVLRARLRGDEALAAPKFFPGEMDRLLETIDFAIDFLRRHGPGRHDLGAGADDVDAPERQPSRHGDALDDPKLTHRRWPGLGSGGRTPSGAQSTDRGQTQVALGRLPMEFAPGRSRLPSRSRAHSPESWTGNPATSVGRRRTHGPRLPRSSPSEAIADPTGIPSDATSRAEWERAHGTRSREVELRRGGRRAREPQGAAGDSRSIRRVPAPRNGARPVPHRRGTDHRPVRAAPVRMDRAQPGPPRRHGPAPLRGRRRADRSLAVHAFEPRAVHVDP